MKDRIRNETTVPTLHEVCAISERAGERILSYFEGRSPLNSRLKEDKSPVSEADLVSNNIIERGLKDLTPEISILSEETHVALSETATDKGRIWLVDPLDGTREFLNGIGEFAVNIALIEDGRPVIGVIHIPTSGRTYGAIKNHGVVVRERGKVRDLFPARFPSRPYKLLTSRYHAPLRNPDPREFELLPCGSSVKFCRLAEGEGHVYARFGPTMEWDTAAGQCLVEEVGGAVVDLEGVPLTYNKSSLYNPHFLAVSSADLLKDHELTESLKQMEHDR
jgi:3'(2'), 5'-bisphosphate nucleotidase